MVGEVSNATKDELRAVLLRAYSTFNFYRRRFDGVGVSREDILRRSPLEIFRMLPLLDGEALQELIPESLSVGEQIIDMETSSSTTGPRKKRYISCADDASETAFLAELFSVCGVGACDRVACLDTDPLTLMVSFTKALDLLGVEEAYAFCAGHDFETALSALPRLDPTTIIAVPSVIERCFNALKKGYSAVADASLSKVIYAGESLSEGLRTRLEEAFDVEVFGYYGTSETSALGIECAAHDGIHLFANRNVIELAADGSKGLTGEIVVTTLRQQTLPLLRYRPGDTIAIKGGECSCGLKFPRVEVMGRAGDSFSILGAKIYYISVLNACYGRTDGTGPMQLLLTRDARDRLTVLLPESLCSRETAMRDSLLRSQPDLDFLVCSRYLDLEFSFVEESHFTSARKPQRVRDLRKVADGDSED